MTIQMQEIAQAYVSSGLSVIPIDPNASKRPTYNLLPAIGEKPDGHPRRGWSPFRERKPTTDELFTWFGNWGSLSGIAVVCGNISGGLEAIDIDSQEHVEPWLSIVREQMPDLFQNLVRVRTPRPGLHVYYRCGVVSGNQKLAKTFKGDPYSADFKQNTIIETRGEGGYALIPPTQGYCHPTGRKYEYVTSQTLIDVVTISEGDRDSLFEIAKTFNIEPPRRQVPSQQTKQPINNVNRSRPGDDFNARANWSELLERHGWSLFNITFDEVQHWTRPGKTEGTSATVDYAGNNLLHVFTSNASPLESEESYNKFSFLAIMEHEGNYKKAARALRQEGYGRSHMNLRAHQRRRGRPYQQTPRRPRRG